MAAVPRVLLWGIAVVTASFLQLIRYMLHEQAIGGIFFCSGKRQKSVVDFFCPERASYKL